MSILKNRKVLVYLVVSMLLVFASGFFVGKCVFNDGKRSHWGKQSYRSHMMTEKFTKALSLNPTQVAQLEVILDRHKESIKEIRQDFRKTYRSHREKKISEIEAILTAEQQVEFKKLREKYKKKRHRRY